MNFQVLPDTKAFGPIPTETLRYAIALKHGLFVKMGIICTIQDSDGYIISESEQSAHIYHLLG